MKLIFRIIALIGSCAIAAQSSLAQGIPVYGLGNLPCSTYALLSLPKNEWELKNMRESENQSENWWSGFVTGYNFSVDKKRQLDHWNPNDMKTWVRTYCTQNPKDILSAAAFQYVTEKVNQQARRTGSLKPTN
jgi:hypothetical protein